MGLRNQLPEIGAGGAAGQQLIQHFSTWPIQSDAQF